MFFLLDATTHLYLQIEPVLDVPLKGNLIQKFCSPVVQVHGSVGEPWWLWVEDPINDHIYHSEYFLLQKKQVFFLFFS